MGADIFLKLTGIPGESVGDGHKGEIDILSWSWGVTPAGVTYATGSGGATKAAAAGVSVVKPADVASRAIDSALANGNLIDEGVLTVRKPGSGEEIIVLTMKQIQVASVAWSKGAGDNVFQNVSLIFKEFTTKSAAHAVSPARDSTTWTTTSGGPA